MGLFNFLKKSNKSDVELYCEERNKNIREEISNDTSFPSTFRIKVEDVFTITGKGTVIVGTVESGFVSVGDNVKLQRVNGVTKDVVVLGIEKFKKFTNVAHKGENVGILLSDITRKDIGNGDILTK